MPTALIGRPSRGGRSFAGCPKERCGSSRPSCSLVECRIRARWNATAGRVGKWVGTFRRNVPNIVRTRFSNCSLKPRVVFSRQGGSAGPAADAKGCGSPRAQAANVFANAPGRVPPVCGRAFRLVPPAMSPNGYLPPTSGSVVCLGGIFRRNVPNIAEIIRHPCGKPTGLAPLRVRRRTRRIWDDRGRSSLSNCQLLGTSRSTCPRLRLATMFNPHVRRS